MRDIKFRALFGNGWDNEKKFYYIENFNLPSVETENCFERLTAWEQYTGLKDKNGKEIYEGDIVQWECPRDKKIMESPVVYEPSGTYAYFAIGVEDGMNYGHLNTWYKVEIVGNIHE